MNSSKKMFSRRAFLAKGSAAAAGITTTVVNRRLWANALGLPLGIQLWSVRKFLRPNNYESILNQLAALGYRDVEGGGSLFFNMDAAEVQKAMQNAGLRCVSAHYPFGELQTSLNQILEFGGKLGLEYIICSSPGRPSQRQTTNPTLGVPMTLDDWRWNAEQLNHMADKVTAAGIKLGYHNHRNEFRAQNGLVPYDVLLERTDPTKITMQMDCGWVVVGGANPEKYLRNYSSRFSMLHIKDFSNVRLDDPPAAELGRGVIDYRPIFAAAQKGRIKHYFVEQEAFLDIPPMAALKVDADYLRNLQA